MTVKKQKPNYASTTNACKLCTPLGAALAFHGVQGSLCLLHGSQGCSTYIRRYIISHYKEPLDIASTNFTEQAAVFGGKDNFFKAIRNLHQQYNPQLIGVATTCLAETMGEDLHMYLSELSKSEDFNLLPKVVHVSTPSYAGSHNEGFHATVRALVDQLTGSSTSTAYDLALLPGMLSPADLRYLKELTKSFELNTLTLPDYSETLDGGLWDDYTPIPAGGTPIEGIKSLGQSRNCLQLGRVLGHQEKTAGALLEERFQVPLHTLGWPCGVKETDRMLSLLQTISQNPVPEVYLKERARLIDSYADGHKVVSGLKAAVYGEEDLVVAMTAFLSEVGVKVVLAVSGGNTGKLEQAMKEILPEEDFSQLVLRPDSDFFDMEEETADLHLDLLVGNSKGYKLASKLKVPLLRVGFPIHDRFGGSRIRLLGYQGAQELFDNLVNLILAQRQEENPVGYTYY